MPGNPFKFSEVKFLFMNPMFTQVFTNLTFLQFFLHSWVWCHIYYTEIYMICIVLFLVDIFNVVFFNYKN